ncbi:MAG: L-fucose isomerase [Ruminococcaceae bacterium]|nr:L-fucose isomerase [Oscillospiraceae bacterium]
MKARIGIRPTIDGRWGGIREGLEKQTMNLAKAAKKLIEENVFYADGTPCEVVISPCTIGGGREAYECQQYFTRENVTATLTVTPCWCYGSETMDLNPLTTKAIWGFNGTERPGAVYLAAAMAAHAQRGLPAFAIYGEDVLDMTDSPITPDVEEKILRFARCSLVVGQIKDKAYVSIGSVSMGIGGSFLDAGMMQKYFGIRAEWVDMTEILRRIDLEIYDKAEYEKELKWIKERCQEGRDLNGGPWGQKDFTREELDAQWEFVAKMTLVIKDIMLGNEKLNDIDRHEEALGRNAIFGGFQGQRMWTDYKPNGDFTEAILNSTFDWNGKKAPIILATESDNCNGLAMLFENLLTGRASVFADVRTYWSPEAVERCTGWKPEGLAKDGFIHLINSGAAALDGTGAVKDENGNSVMKKWWDVEDEDISAMLSKTEFSPANRGYFRGGGFSSTYSTNGEMPVTLVRVNMVEGIGYTMQIAEGYTVDVPEKVNRTILDRTDPTWPSTYFVPRLDENVNAFSSVYNVMANWGANHGAFVYGHIGKDLITLASMFRIPVTLHNIKDKDIYRPHAWTAFGTRDLEGADFRACANYKELYK